MDERLAQVLSAPNNICWLCKWNVNGWREVVFALGADNLGRLSCIYLFFGVNRTKF